MGAPVRLQLSRKKGFRLQDHSLAVNGLPAVKVDRSTIWGNNFDVDDFESVEECVMMFEHDLDKFARFHHEKFERYIKPLIGKNLACWCKPGAPCHADILLEQASEYGAYLCVEAI